MPRSAVGPKGPKCRCEQVTSLRLRGYGETSDRKRRVENAPPDSFVCRCEDGYRVSETQLMLASSHVTASERLFWSEVWV